MYYFEPIEGARYHQDYQKLEWELQQAKDSGDGQKALEMIRQNAREDLFFLIFFVLGIHTINAPWLVDRINEVENDRNMSATFWPREHFKTTIKTYAQTIQDLLRNPEARIGLFSHTRDISKSILRRIMYTLERNMMLKLSFPDVLYMKPRTTPGVKFSEDEGVIVQRRGEYNESTIEAWGLVDGMPTSKHFTIMKLDDLETEKAVSTPEQIRKLKDAFALAFNLSERRGIIEIIGTIYDFGSLHYDIKNSPDWKVSCWGAEDAAFLTPEELEKKRRLMGDWVYACQMENNPIQLDERRMSVDWLKYHRGGVDIGRNRYIVVDPARTKGNDSDFTVMWVFEVDSRKNYIFLDVVRDKMSLSERWDKLRGLVEKWNNVIRVGYAKTAFEQDIEYIRERQSRDGVFFSIIPITETKQKLRRMETLQPLFKDGRIILPQNKIYSTLEGKQLDLIEIFVKDEYLAFPSMAHDDMLDAMAMCRHEEMGANASLVEEPSVAIKIHPILIRDKARGRLQWMVR